MIGAKIQSIINVSCVRMSLVLKSCTHFFERRGRSELILFYKIINGDARQYLKDLLSISVHQRNRHNVRTGYNLYSIRTRTNLFNVSFFSSVIRLWNDLPLAARNAETLDELKNKLNRDKRKVNPLYYICCMASRTTCTCSFAYEMQ